MLAQANDWKSPYAGCEALNERALRYSIDKTLRSGTTAKKPTSQTLKTQKTDITKMLVWFSGFLTGVATILLINSH